MNKTVTTNIGGFIFHIDDIAYDKLSQYLNTIKGYFKQSEGRDEIIGDIEARIAEMFREKTGPGKQVIILKDVDEVIAVMGQPEAFAESGDATGADADQSLHNRPATRRIFRDPDDKVLGGVCSGISAYFDVPPLTLRIAFIIGTFIFGITIVLYIVLWVIIPEAGTTAEKLEMRGESVNISNIERTIREEFKDLDREGKIRRTVHEIITFAARFLRIFFKVAGKITGAFFLIVGLLLLVLATLSLLGYPTMVDVNNHGEDIRISLQDIMYHFLGTPELNTWAGIGLALVICIPLVSLIFAGIRLLFNIRKTNKYIGWSMSGLWIAGVIICLAVVNTVYKDFKVPALRKDVYTLSKPKTAEVLYLTTVNNFSDQEEQSSQIESWMVFNADEESILFKTATLDIKKSSSDSIELEVRLSAKGPTRKDALDRTDKIHYAYSQVDSVLTFDKYMNLEKGDKWKAQNLKLILRIPVGQTIFISKEMGHIIYDIKNVTNTQDYEMVNRRWKMTQEGLACVDCDNLKNNSHPVYEDDLDQDELETPEPLVVPVAPEPPVPPAKQKLKVEAIAKDTAITREQYEQLSKLNRMYLELKYPDTNLIL